MDGLTLLTRARTAGLTVEPRGDQLVIRGPKVAEAIVKELISHKAAVMAALTATSAPPSEVHLTTNIAAGSSSQGQKRHKQDVEQAGTQAASKPDGFTRVLDWPNQPTESRHHILGQRLQWTDKQYRIETFPEDGAPVFTVLTDVRGWRPIAHCRSLSSAKAYCETHQKHNGRKNHVRKA